MQALIDFIIRNLLALWPVARVYSWQRGLRIRGGHIGTEIGPGLHWRWPFMEEVYKVNTSEYTIDLPTGTITTTDGQNVLISANIGYRTINIRLQWLNVNDVDKSISNRALGFLAAECAACSWETLRSGRGNLQQRFADHMTEGMRDWGVEITAVHLTDCVRVRPMRLFSESPLPK